MLKFDKAYVETGQQTYERLFKERTICNLQRKGTNALHELPIGEALDQIAEPDQRGQNRHHALLAKAKYCLIHEDL